MIRHKPLKAYSKDAYALPLALILLAFVSVTGVALIGWTVSSATTGAASDQLLRAQSRAEDGLLWWETQFEKKLNDAGTIDPGQAESKLTAIVGAIQPPPNAGFTLDPPPQIRTIEIQEENASQNTYSAYVTVSIKGTAGSHERTVRRTYLVSTAAQQFLFGLVTEGKLTLNGAAYIKGDGLIGGALSVSPNAQYVWKGASRREYAGYAAWEGSLSSGVNYMNLYINNQEMRVALNDENLKQGFVVPPKLSRSSAASNPIQVADIVRQHNQRPSLPESAQEKECFKFLGFEYCHGPVDKSLKSREQRSGGYWVNNLTLNPGAKLTVVGDVLVEGNLTIGAGAELRIEQGNLYVAGQLTLQGQNNQTQSATLLLDPDRKTYVKQSSTLSNATLRGTLYSNGTVTVQNSLWNRSTIYTAGNAEISEFKMQDQNFTIVLAEGNILVKNNNLFNSTPLIMNAYFYSNQDITLYGVGSNIEVHGGISGKNVTFNAVKGNSRDCGSTICFEPGHPSLPVDRSRLKIYYNADMILNPPSGIYQPGPFTYKIYSTSLDTEN
ncbi:MAG: hypothetical protein IMW86_08140 [Hydrogenibacillus sp.]|nr:hypothetical protein [Hydrogenibacillus sp.]